SLDHGHKQRALMGLWRSYHSILTNTIKKNCSKVADKMMPKEEFSPPAPRPTTASHLRAAAESKPNAACLLWCGVLPVGGRRAERRRVAVLDRPALATGSRQWAMDLAKDSLTSWPRA